MVVMVSLVRSYATPTQSFSHLKIYKLNKTLLCVVNIFFKVCQEDFIFLSLDGFYQNPEC